MPTVLRQELRSLLGPDFRPSESGPLIGVAQPATETELATIVATAAEAGVHIVPKGSGTSPYGGSVASAGLVVSFAHFNRILAIDPVARLVTVEPGVLWQDLIDGLLIDRLMPRVYPSSRGFSTIGGFVAQGGVGIGSYQFGSIGESIDNVRVIDARGQAKDLGESELDLVVGAEGRTGLLSRLTLRLQPWTPMSPVLGSFAHSDQLEACFASCATLPLRIWSVSFIDPAASAMRSMVGGPREPRLPEDRYTALFLTDAGADDLALLASAIGDAGGSVTHQGGDPDRWIDRLMTVQVLRTTAIPMQFMLPAGHLGAMLEAIPPEARQHVGFEGVLVAGGSTLVVRFILTSRPFSASENLDLASRLIGLAQQVGGSSYSTGLFFPAEAEAELGSERLQRLREFRNLQDPKRLLNAGKAFFD